MAEALGVTEGAVRTAVKAGRIKREGDRRFDLDRCRADWARTTDPVRSKVRKTGPAAATHYAPAAEPAPIADAAQLWLVMAEMPCMSAWHAAGAGCTLQQAFDASADMALDLAGSLKVYFGAVPPGPFDPVQWDALADDHGLPPIPEAALRADWQARRDTP